MSFSNAAARRAVTRLEVVAVLVVLGLAGYLLVPAYHQARVGSARQACLANLGQIGRALAAYLEANDQRWPYVSKLASLRLHQPPWPTMPEVLSPYLDRSAGAYRCPADARLLEEGSDLAKRYGKRTTWHETEGTSYEWLWGEIYGGRRVGEETLARAGGFGMGRADQPLLSDFEPFHRGDGGGAFNTLNADLTPRTTRARER